MSSTVAVSRDEYMFNVLSGRPTIKPGSKRWVLVNRRTGKASRAFSSRSAARAAKTPNFRIFDQLKLTYVR